MLLIQVVVGIDVLGYTFWGKNLNGLLLGLRFFMFELGLKSSERAIKGIFTIIVQACD